MNKLIIISPVSNITQGSQITFPRRPNSVPSTCPGADYARSDVEFHKTYKNYMDSMLNQGGGGCQVVCCRP